MGNTAERPTRPPHHAAEPRAGRAGRAQVGRWVYLLLAAVLVTLATGFGLASLRDYRDTLADGWRLAGRGAVGAAEQGRRSLTVAQLISDRLQSVLGREGVDQFLSDAWPDIEQLARESAEIGSIWVLDANGNLLATSLARSTPRLNLADRPYFAPLRDGAETYLLPLSWGPVSKLWFLGVNHALRGEGGRFLGVVQVSLHSRDFHEAYAALGFPPETSAGLFRATDGAPLMLWPEPPPQGDDLVPATAPPYAAALVRAAAGGARDGRLLLPGADGRETLIAWRRLAGNGSVLAAMAVPRDVVMAPFLGRMLRNAALTGIAALFLGALGWGVLAAQRRAAASEARFRGTFDQAAVGMAHVALDGTWLRANARLCEMLGYREDELLARTFQSVTHPDDLDADLAQAADLRAGKIATYTMRKRYIRGDGTLMWGELTASLLRDERSGAPLHFISVIKDVTERVAAQVALAESEERMALASEAAGVGIWDTDTSTNLATVNAVYRRLYGLPPGKDKLTFAERRAHTHPDDAERIRERARIAKEGLEDFNEEFRILREDTGEVRWIASRGSAVGEGPDRHRFVGISMDITERRAEQERQTLLAREVDHRARNVLAVVRSILKLTRADDPRRFAAAVEGRVEALARAHTLLARDNWTGAGLAEVVREELAAYGDAQRTVIDGPPLRLLPGAVQPLAMVLHELATNAAKHGALSRPEGHVAVRWQLRPPVAQPGAPADNRRLVLDWTERGGPPVPGVPTVRGFGSMVVEASVRSQLRGSSTLHWDPEGLRCTIDLPVDRVAAVPPAAEPAQPGQAPPGVALPDPPLPNMALPNPPPAHPLAGRRVLLVEDEPLVAMEAAAALSALGCEVVGPAASRAEALRLAQSASGALDAAVLDLNLGGESSLSVADMLTAQGVPVIHVTGYDALPPGAAHGAGRILLTKPLRDGDLAAALHRSLARAEAEAGGGAPTAPAAEPR